MVSFAAMIVASSMVVGQTPKVDLPEQARKSLEYFVGEWTGEWKQGESSGTHKTTVQWAPGKQCTISHYEMTGPEGVIQGTFVSGWDPEKKQIVDTVYEANGWAYEDRWTIKSDILEEGSSKSIAPDGNVQKGKCRTEKNGPDEFTYTKFDYSEGNKKVPDSVWKYRRVSQKSK